QRSGRAGPDPSSPRAGGGGGAGAAMQTLHELARSLNDPRGLEAGLEKLRDGLLEIPRMLQLCESAQDDVSLGRVSGDHNFRFTFRLEGGGFFQTGVLIAAAESFTSNMPIPLKCKWKRRVGDLPVEIPGVTSNMYQSRPTTWALRSGWRRSRPTPTTATGAPCSAPSGPSRWTPPRAAASTTRWRTAAAALPPR
ncbi:unnamed protein product, partial [Prorocentrum cordatum]